MKINDIVFLSPSTTKNILRALSEQQFGSYDEDNIESDSETGRVFKCWQASYRWIIMEQDEPLCGQARFICKCLDMDIPTYWFFKKYLVKWN